MRRAVCVLRADRRRAAGGAECAAANREADSRRDSDRGTSAATVRSDPIRPVDHCAALAARLPAHLSARVAGSPRLPDVICARSEGDCLTVRLSAFDSSACPVRRARPLVPCSCSYLGVLVCGGGEFR